MNEEERIKHIQNSIKNDETCMMYSKMDNPFSFKDKKLDNSKAHFSCKVVWRNYEK